MAIAAAIGVLLGGGFLVVSIYAFREYGSLLFIGSPLMMGAISSYVYNRSVRRSYATSISLGIITILVAASGLLLFAFEGLICIAMAIPMAVPLSILGTVIGKAIADFTPNADRGLMSCVGVLFVMMPIEARFRTPQEYVVASVVEIAASPDQVWDRVISFPEITSPEPWLFRWGIAGPRRARIEGTGVGAVRYCEFTTGDFVEPISVWEPNQRLAFDVQDQPDPLFELSPYGHIHPPHLDGFMKSKRGEFRLIALPNGTTRLEGRTWYEIDMYPQAYWRLWCDSIVHQIHLRVLRHIASTDEW